MKKLSIILVVLWMILIFTFSNQPGNISTKQSDIVVSKVSKIIKIDDLKYITLVVRKTAHFILYVILGILIINMLHYYQIKDIVILSILICILYACSDEIHQLFITGRSGEIKDVFIDSIGSILGIYSYKKIVK